MATKKQIEAVARRFNADAEIGNACDGDYSIQVWSPAGSVWMATGCHVICRQFGNGSESWKPDAYAEVIEEMQDGLVACEDRDCEHCHE